MIFDSKDNEAKKVSTKTKIIRSVAVFIIILLTVFITTSIVMGVLSNRPHSIGIKINSLSVSNFKVTERWLTGEWDAKFTAINKDQKLETHITQLDYLISYVDYVAVVVTSEQHLKLKPNKSRIIHKKIKKTRWRKKGGIPEPFEKIDEDRKNGTLAFKITALVTTVVFPNTWWEEKTTKCYSCGDLRLKFFNQSNGSIIIHDGTCHTG